MINCTYVSDYTRKGNNDGLFGDYLYALIGKFIDYMASKFYSVLSTEDVEDLIQDTWMKINDKKEQFNPDGNFEGWVYSICRNSVYALCNKTAKLKGKQTALPEDYEVKGSPAFLGERGTDFDIIQREETDRIERGIQTLKPHNQKVVRLLIDGVPYNKMAPVLGCSENTVKTQVCRVRQVLRKVI